jgi:translation initiation factor 1
MSKKNLVYSTNPNWQEEIEKEEITAPSMNQQKLRVRLETKHRGGKKATIVAGLQGSDVEMETLAKTIKTKLGTGGSAKDGEIIIQGDYVVKIKSLLILLGYKDTK